MKKTIKIIDLFVKIANGEELPRIIKYCDIIFEFDDDNGFYYNGGFSLYRTLYSAGNCLNDEVEILDEEEFEDIIPFIDNSEQYNFSSRQNGITKEDRRLLDSNFKDIYITINQLIKNQKKIIERLKSDE